MNRTCRLRPHRLWIAIGATIIGIFLSRPALADLPTTILHTFMGGRGDGAKPFAGLTLSGSTLYGTTQEGDGSIWGTVFSVDTGSNKFTLLHSFVFGPGDGNQPRADLAVSGSSLYGTCSGGGTSGLGTIFRLDTGSNTVARLHSFIGEPVDGFSPQAGLTLAGSTMYGTTQLGGVSTWGTVFRLDATTNAFTLLHSFTDEFGDGSRPLGGLILSGSTLYGTTQQGGALGKGTVFSIDAASSQFALLHSFAGGVADGDGPVAGLTLSGSTLYGTTAGGGTSGKGTLFSLDINTNKFTLLHSFTGGTVDGADPVAGLTLFGSTLYGTTQGGGVSALGTIFSFDTARSAYKRLHSFAGGAGDGAIQLQA